MPKVLVILDPQDFKALQRLAQDHDRVVDQEARFLLRQALQHVGARLPSRVGSVDADRP